MVSFRFDPMIIIEFFYSNSSLRSSRRWKDENLSISFLFSSDLIDEGKTINERPIFFSFESTRNDKLLSMNSFQQHLNLNLIRSDFNEQVKRRIFLSKRKEIVDKTRKTFCLEWKSSIRTSSFIWSRSSTRKLIFFFVSSFCLTESQKLHLRLEKCQKKVLHHSSLSFLSLSLSLCFEY